MECLLRNGWSDQRKADGCGYELIWRLERVCPLVLHAVSFAGVPGRGTHMAQFVDGPLIACGLRLFHHRFVIARIVFGGLPYLTQAPLSLQSFTPSPAHPRTNHSTSPS